MKLRKHRTKRQNTVGHHVALTAMADYIDYTLCSPPYFTNTTSLALNVLRLCNYFESKYKLTRYRELFSVCKPAH